MPWDAFLHWFNVHLWAPMWPNMFAPSAITLAAVAISHVKARHHRENQHEALKQHIEENLRKHLGGNDK